MTSDEQVEQLYQAYPRKVAVRRAKIAIRAALERASYEDMLAGVLRYAEQAEQWKRSQEWHPDIAYPSTWFNGDRWEDESAPVACRVTYQPGADYAWCWKNYEAQWRGCGCKKCVRMIKRWVRP